MKEFTVGTNNFRVDRLKVKDSLRGLKLVGKVLIPAMAEAHAAPAGQVGNAVTRAVEGLDCLPDLLDLFVAKTKYMSDERPNWTELSALVENVFGGRPDHVVQYIVECVQGEYGHFLDENGPLAGLVSKAMAKGAAPAASNSPTTT